MKKIFSTVAMAATVLFASCGMGTSSTTSTGSNTTSELLGAVLGSVAGTTTGTTSTTSSLASAGLSILSSLLGGNSVNTNSIVGTWKYAQPQVTFESSSVLGNIGGELMGNKIESVLNTQLEKIGLKAGVSTFTFDNSGNVTVTLSKKTTTGTYTLSGNTLTMTGALGLATVKCTVSIQSNTMYMLFDANTLFQAITKLGGTSSTISSLLGNFSGMKLGWSMTK